MREADEIGLVYRHPKQNRYSIETLFSGFDGLPGVRKIVLPAELNSIVHLFRLWFFSFSIPTKKLHITGDVNFVALFVPWKKILITIHDLNHYEDLTGIRRKIYGWIWFSLPLWFAKTIAVISPYTKMQLLEHFKVDERKITIIPNSFTPKAKIGAQNTANEGNFRILCIGNKENKNIARLVKALPGMQDVELRFVGRQSDAIESALLAAKIPFSTVANLSQDELQAEYAKADMLYFASTKEGFGLPILEAQSAGIPVLTSTTTAMPFVAGDGALLVDPYSEEDIRHGIQSIRNGGPAIEALLQRGFENIRRFSQAEFVASYQKLYAAL